MKTIYSFKPGDKIVRIIPAKPLESILGKLIKDRSYMGDKMLFKGIANGQIYLKRLNDLDISLWGDKLLDLPLDLWDEGWDYWVDPETLDEVCLNEEDIEDLIKEAIDNEDYELAADLKKLNNKI
tara:strand:- start:214 stop:588 length:375 start_codon:yes stop_codon:yes gene_type:complete